MIARLIAQYHPTGVLDGIPIMLSKKEAEDERQGQSDTDDALEDSLFVMAMMKLGSFKDRFKHFREQAITMLNDNRLWHDGCLKPADKMTCRKLLLQQRFACSYWGLEHFFHTLIKPQHCPSETELKVRTLPVPRTASDPDNFIDNPPEVRQDFSLSAAGKRVLAKIKAMKLGDPDPRSLDKIEPGSSALTNVLLEAAGLDFEPTELVAVVLLLSEEDLHVIQTEVERLFIHVHRKDLHLNTPADPMHKQDVAAAMPHLKNFPITEKVAEIFLQQTLLPANKTPQDIEFRHLHHVLNIKFDATSATLKASPFSPLSFALPHDEILAIKFNTTTTATCRTAKDTKRCEFEQIALDTAYCKNCENAQLSLTLHLKQDQRVKPPPSPVTLQLNGKRYHFELLCSKQQPDAHPTADRYDDSYLCTTHDTWQIGAAFAQLIADPHSAFHSDYFNPAALIRDMLKNLGYDKPLADN